MNNSHICLPFPLSFFLFALPIVPLNLAGALVALLSLGAGVGDDLGADGPLLRIDSSASRANYSFNLYYIIIASAS
jgi:hypothetical protein